MKKNLEVLEERKDNSLVETVGDCAMIKSDLEVNFFYNNNTRYNPNYEAAGKSTSKNFVKNISF